MKIEQNDDVFPPRKFYVELEPKFLNFTKDCRVLPVTYFEEHNTVFHLKAKFEPGEKRTFPNGGFEVYGPEGSTHNFDLDQVMVHPFHLRMARFFSKKENTVKEKIVNIMGNGKRGRPKTRPEGFEAPAYVPTGGKRGRKPMSDEDRVIRDAKLANKKPSSGKRGRAPLSAEEKAKREEALAIKRAKSSGKRGRPKKA